MRTSLFVANVTPLLVALSVTMFAIGINHERKSPMAKRRRGSYSSNETVQEFRLLRRELQKHLDKLRTDLRGDLATKEQCYLADGDIIAAATQLRTDFNAALNQISEISQRLRILEGKHEAFRTQVVEHFNALALADGPG